MAKSAVNSGDGGEAPAPVDKPICGIVMPISSIEDCPAAHWLDVRNILEDAAAAAGFKARLVSAAEYAGVILKEIIHNLYHDPIVVCDVSGRNPNVMFELGLRLAFDKPTILIKDDKTDYAFDTSPIEHLEYPRGLRYGTMVEFKEKLAEKIKATHKQATTDRKYTTFLKHLGEFKIATVETTEVSSQEFMIEELKAIKGYLRDMTRRDLARADSGTQARRREIEFKLSGDKSRVPELLTRMSGGIMNDIDATVTDDGVVFVTVSREDARRSHAALTDIAKDLGFELDARLRGGISSQRGLK